MAIQSVVFGQYKMPHFDNKEYVPGEIIVQLTAESELENILKSAPSTFELELQKYLSPPMRVWLLKFNDAVISTEQMQAWLYQQKSVVVADYNYYVEVRSTLPGDPSINQQWHHNNTGQTGGTVDADIDSDLAWDITTGGTTATNDDIVVCMVEGSGGNLNHQDLSPNRWINYGEIPDNNIDDDNNGYVDDYYGWNTVNQNDDTGTGSHGTNCLGMIGAKGDNGLNVVGANWDVKLMVVNMGNLTQASVIEAYTYPLVLRKQWNQSGGTKGAFVVATSASWGIDNGNPANYPLWCQFYDTLGYHGIINVGATTNSNLNVDTAGDVPTACSSPYMVGVGRTDHNDNTAGGYGVNTIDFGAPGINVVTTNGTNGITTTTGTSFACPLTAGVIGLAYAIPCPTFMSIVKANPKQGADLVLDALINGVDVKSQLASKFITGGRLNARNTLDLLMESSCSACTITSSTATPNETVAQITFDANEEVITTDFYYRVVGTSNWTILENVQSPINLSNLTECTSYEYYFASVCADETTESTVSEFRTLGCGNCVDLIYCNSKGTGSSTARFAYTTSTGSSQTITDFVLTQNWGGSVSANYNYGNLVLMNGTGTPNEGCGTISNATDLAGNIAVAVRGTCNFSEKAVNAQNAGATALVIINNQASAPTSLGSGTGAASVTIPVIMISQSQGATLLNVLTNGGSATGILGVQKQWIEKVALNTLNSTSGNNNGYYASTDIPSVEMERETSYNMQITAGFGNQALPLKTRVWIDMNQDGVFDSGELLMNENTSNTNAITGSIVIPQSAPLGDSKMRVQLAYQGVGQTGVQNVCGDFTWGEVEDYCIRIVANDPSASVQDLGKLTFKIYPNPSDKQLNFELDKSIGKAKITILDLMGRTIEQIDVNSSTYQLDVSKYSNGTYIFYLKSSTDEVVKTGKFIVNH